MPSAIQWRERAVHLRDAAKTARDPEKCEILQVLADDCEEIAKGLEREAAGVAPAHRTAGHA